MKALIFVVGVVVLAACRSQSLPPVVSLSPETTLTIEDSTGSPPFHATPAASLAASETSLPVLTPTADAAFKSLKVVYNREDRLWLWSDGESSPIPVSGEAYSPRISPDGQVVAYLRPVDDFHVEIWAINLDGTDERRLVSVADLEAAGGSSRDPNAVAIIPHRFEWLPGGHMLAFNTEYVFQGPGTVLLNDFNLVDAGTSDLNYQLLTDWGGEFFPSPDGEQIALTTPTNIILSNLDGSDWKSVFNFEQVITYSDYFFYPATVWSEDNNYLLLALPPRDPLGAPPEATRIYRIDVATSAVQEIGQITAVPFFDTPVEFSPRLDHLAYIMGSAAAEENIRSLMIAQPDGSGSRPYFEGYLLQFLGWNPGGDGFAFTVGDDQELYLGGLNLPATDQSPEIYGIFDLRWLDDQRFLYLQTQGEQTRLCLAAAGGEPVVIDLFSSSRPDYDFILPENFLP